MTEWTEDFDMTTVPDKQLHSEVGRRRGALGHIRQRKEEPCKGCGLLLSARERREACPRCGHVHKRIRNRKKNQSSAPRARIELPCVQCGHPLSARERRKPCPGCASRQPRESKT